jgi:hypothetical protein
MMVVTRASIYRKISRVPVEYNDSNLPLRKPWSNRPNPTFWVILARVYIRKATITIPKEASTPADSEDPRTSIDV